MGSGAQMKRLIVDARSVDATHHSFARYITQLAKGLKEMSELPYHVEFLVTPEGAKNSEALSGFPVHPVTIPFLHPAELFKIPNALKNLKADAYHSPTFSAAIGIPCPYAATIHDLNHLTFGSKLKKAYYSAVLKPFLKRADQVVTVSEFSRRAIADWMGIAPEKIAVAYNVINPFLNPREPIDSESVLRKYALEKGAYFLSLSNPKRHKNLSVLVRAYARYRERVGASVALPLVLSVNSVSEIEGLNPSESFSLERGVMCLGNLSENEAKILNGAAKAAFFPSLFEGFGMPPIEASVMGIPLCVSEIPPHREGLVDVKPAEAHWCDPRDEQAWSEAFSLAQEGRLVGASFETRQSILHRWSAIRLAKTMDPIYRRMLRL